MRGYRLFFSQQAEILTSILVCAIGSCHDMGRGIVELDRQLNRGRPLLGPSDSSRTTRDGADGAVEQVQIRIWRGDQEARHEKRRNREVEMTSIGQRLTLDCQDRWSAAMIVANVFVYIRLLVIAD